MAETSSRAIEQRRFSSLMIYHPALESHGALRLTLGRSIAAATALEFGGGMWPSYRSEYVVHQNYYPAHVVDANLQRREDGFAHDIYVAEGSLLSGTKVLLLASPYVRLLQRLVGELDRRVGAPAIRYLNLDMPSIYKAFEKGSPGMTATKVTLQMLNEPGLELVSLTGRNPLNSDLHASLKEVAAPYALRTEVTIGEDRARVNLDRHGNLWWYQTDESKFRMTLMMLATLAELNALKTTLHMPLDRGELDDEPS